MHNYQQKLYYTISQQISATTKGTKQSAKNKAEPKTLKGCKLTVFFWRLLMSLLIYSVFAMHCTKQHTYQKLTSKKWNINLYCTIVLACR